LASSKFVIEIPNEFACANGSYFCTNINIPFIPCPRLFHCLLGHCVSDPDSGGKALYLPEMQMQFQGRVIQYKANSLVVGVVDGREQKTTSLLKCNKKLYKSCLNVSIAQSV
jgi:hypothetical protein